ncbi:MAG: DegV family protein [Bacillota bacterium]
MIAIVTDSTAYLTKKEAKALGVRMVPMTYTVSGLPFNESFVDQNGNYERLIFHNLQRCTTSQAPISAFMSVFEELMRQNYEVFCIVISSRLSGTYSSASIAAKEVNRDKIIVVDSLTTAGGLAMLVNKAKKLADEGVSLPEITRIIEESRNNVGIAFSVDNMDALRRSGRLGIVRQSVGTILNIRPILLCEDGAVVAHGVTRGRSEQIKELIARIPQNAKRVIVHHLGEKINLDVLISGIKKKFPSIKIGQCKLGPVLGIHLGQGVIGVSWMTE